MCTRSPPAPPHLARTPGFGVVKVATAHDGAEWAVKIMTLPKPKEKPANDGATYEEITNEVQVLAKVKHPNCLYMKVRLRLCCT